MQKPSVGRIVTYTLTEKDVEDITRRRVTTHHIASKMSIGHWPKGAQAHLGNEPKVGDVVPMVIVKVNDEVNVAEDGEKERMVASVNGRAFLDGTDELWLQNALEGAHWNWPVIVK